MQNPALGAQYKLLTAKGILRLVPQLPSFDQWWGSNKQLFHQQVFITLIRSLCYLKYCGYYHRSQNSQAQTHFPLSTWESYHKLTNFASVESPGFTQGKPMQDGMTSCSNQAKTLWLWWKHIFSDKHYPPTPLHCEVGVSKTDTQRHYFHYCISTEFHSRHTMSLEITAASPETKTAWRCIMTLMASSRHSWLLDL